jgi:transcriptional regulator with XRE-family HTH domain
MDFGTRMRIKRKALDLTLVELGEKVGYSHAALSAMETGRSSGGRGCAKAVKAFLGLRGGATVGKAKKPTKTPRKPKASSSALETMALLIAAMERLQASVDGLTAALVPKPPAVDPALVPPVAEQRARTAAMTTGIAQNGLRKPRIPPTVGARMETVASNSLDRAVGYGA